ncbi:exopolyphosphatase / guanosine-5'-triphosphate,3'-diphosphate pyrophosphatase [Kibdelosporangium aridum]|uniref:Exopolyphosphatase / guanosine-5'-triphosphate,3'-diphosphate pyrophosphatase n=1 Tax=Kibdelosporangium aridum TaxID=2030 RepID=A0A1W1ZI30_KIBAR|nr:exopolyphosphatase / guanosine-5'-triphosphate,3'-diphosphate pyrophosphatase [Kibdelosporangium aridum]
MGRVGVLDIGCFSAHLVVVDRADGTPSRPSSDHKVRLRLDRAIDTAGRLSQDGVDQITRAVTEILRLVQRDVEVVAYATSSIRDAANADRVLRQITRRTGVNLLTFSGEREAQLSYVAARHWFGHAAGPLTVLDVGGGTAEVAAGRGTQPHTAVSLPLGARTLTQTCIANGMPLKEVRATTSERVRDALQDTDLTGMAVGCSKVMQQLARLAGARPQREGPLVTRHLHLSDLRKWIPRLGDLTAAQRAELPGISRHRARQSLAGAVVVEALLVATGHESVRICPWATQEGLLLELLEHPDDPASLSHNRRFAS